MIRIKSILFSVVLTQLPAALCWAQHSQITQSSDDETSEIDSPNVSPIWVTSSDVGRDIRFAMGQALVYRHQGDFDKAIKELEKLFGGSIDFHGDDQGQNLLLAAIENHPQLYNASKLLGSIMLDKGEVDKAIGVYEQLEEVKGNVFYSFELVDESDDIDSAFSIYFNEDRMIEDGDLYNKLGWALAVSGKLESSIIYFEKALNTPESTSDLVRERAANNCGLVKLHMGDVDGAQDAFEIAVDRFDSDFAREALVDIHVYQDSVRQREERKEQRHQSSVE